MLHTQFAFLINLVLGQKKPKVLLDFEYASKTLFVPRKVVRIDYTRVFSRSGDS